MPLTETQASQLAAAHPDTLSKEDRGAWRALRPTADEEQRTAIDVLLGHAPAAEPAQSDAYERGAARAARTDN